MYKNAGQFPEGTFFLEELQLSLKAEADVSCTEPSERAFFPGEFDGADATVKDSQRRVASSGWGYYNSNHHEEGSHNQGPLDGRVRRLPHRPATTDEGWTQS
jgi:hypothetical protein